VVFSDRLDRYLLGSIHGRHAALSVYTDSKCANHELFDSDRHGRLYICWRIMDILRETLVHRTRSEYRLAERFIVVLGET